MGLAQLARSTLITSFTGTMDSSLTAETSKIAAIKQQEQAETERKEEVLQVYFDRISVLLMDSLLLEITDKETLSPKQQKILDTTWMLFELERYLSYGDFHNERRA